MLDSKIKEQLTQHFSKITSPVTLKLTTSPSCSPSKELIDLATELSELSELVALEMDGDAVRAPTLTVTSEQKGTNIGFSGVPTGHEFTSLVLAILQSGGVEPKFNETQVSSAKRLGAIDVEIYISLSCQNCPEVVQAFNALAAINSEVKVTMIDGALFQDEVNQREIMAVPSVFINGEEFAQGRMGVDEILLKLDGELYEQSKGALHSKGVFDVLVVGGGAAGASSAIYSARKGLVTGIVADRFGGQMVDTVDIENFISVSKTTGSHLVKGLESHVGEYDIDVMTGLRAISIAENDEGLKVVGLSNGATLLAKSVVLSTGARWRELDVQGEREYRGKGVAYCPHCDGPLFKGKKTAVIGGGNSAIEAAIDLAGITEHVTVLEFAETCRADEVLMEKVASLSNVTIVTSAQTTSINGSGGKVNSLNYTDRVSKESRVIDIEGVFVQIGLVPNTEWLAGSMVDISPSGEIEINERCETTMSGVFAAGDATTTPYKQIIIAMGEGAKASLSAFDYLIRL